MYLTDKQFFYLREYSNVVITSWRHSPLGGAMLRVKQEALLLALVTIFCETTTSKFHVNTDKNRIVDGAGRERLFHGTNVVQKTAPFIPITTHFDAR